jgi:glycosyltransferase involved in cell wall biosynthesis
MAALISRSAPRVARHFIASEADAAQVRGRQPGLPLEIVPNAVAAPESAPRRDDGATLLFLGSFGYAPNGDAVRWFVGDIWPLVRARRPDARFLIAGRGSERLGSFGSGSGVTVLGPVADVADAYAAATLCVAPLRAGAGTRLKILEAAAHRVPIVATGLALRGLPFLPERDLLVADSARDFAGAIDATLTYAPARRKRAESAYSIVRDGFERSRVVERLACRLAEIAAR